MGHGADHDAIRRCDILQPRSQIWRVTDYRALLCLALADEFADHYGPCCDPNPHSEPRLASGCQIGDGLDDRERCVDRALGVAFARLGIAEIGEDPIAHVLSQEPVVPLDDRRYGVLIRSDQLVHVLGIELGRQSCGSCEITKHDRQVTALSPRFGARDCRRCANDRRSHWETPAIHRHAAPSPEEITVLIESCPFLDMNEFIHKSIESFFG